MLNQGDVITLKSTAVNIVYPSYLYIVLFRRELVIDYIGSNGAVELFSPIDNKYVYGSFTTSDLEKVSPKKLLTKERAIALLKRGRIITIGTCSYKIVDGVLKVKIHSKDFTKSSLWSTSEYNCITNSAEAFIDIVPLKYYKDYICYSTAGLPKRVTQ